MRRRVYVSAACFTDVCAGDAARPSAQARGGAPPTAMAPAATVRRFRPLIESKFGMDVPSGYCFHPCHTWAVDEGWQLIRVGIDKFAVNLFGKIEHIDVAGLYRWVRQGQKL